MFLEECKYVAIEKKMPEYITDDIETFTDDSDREDSEEENFDKENKVKNNRMWCWFQAIHEITHRSYITRILKGQYHRECNKNLFDEEK